MENKDYNNIVKSMQLSHHWYLSDESLASELRYGVFIPSNELIIELMEENGFWLLSEVIQGCEYTKNLGLLYLLTEFMLAKWKSKKNTPQEDDIENCLYASLKTMYRLLEERTIAYGDEKIERVLDDYRTNVDIEKCKPILDILLKKYFSSNIELTEASQEFIKNEEERQNRIREMHDNYARRYIDSYNDSYNIISFLKEALKAGMITIEANGTIKSPFIEEENDFQVDPNIIFKLDSNIQSYIIKEGIDEGKIQVIEGMDFLIPKKPNVKNL